MKNIFEKRVNILPYEYPSLLAYKDAIRHAYWLHCVGDNQRVVTSEGMFTVKELYEQDKELILFDGVKEVKSSKMIRTGHRSIYRLTTKEGYVHDVTNDHRVLTKDGWKEVKDLVVDDKLIIQTKKGLFGKEHFPELAFLIGHYQGDGHNHGNGYAWHVWSHEYHFIDELELALNKVYSHYDLKGKVPTFGTEHVTSQNVRSRKMISKRIPYTFVKGVVPELVWRGTEETIKSYLKGLYITDGCVYQSKKHQSIKISQSNYDFICEIQLLLLNLGIKSTVYKKNGCKRLMPDGKGGCDLYNAKDSYTIEVTHYESVKLINEFTNLFESRGKVYREIANPNKSNPIIEVRFLSLEYLYDDYVYCVSVDNKEYPAWVCNGFVTHNTEFNFTTDIDDYRTKISHEEREVIKRTMLAIAQIEVNVKTFWADLYKRMPITEIGDVGMTFAECHGEGTEILTPKGWVNFKDIDNNTEVIQYDLETNTMTSVLPSNIINEPYKGKMYRIENQTYNALLTPNHNIYYKTRSGNIIKKAIKDIGKFSSDMKLPFSGKFVNEGVDDLSLDDKINIGNFDCIDLSDKSEKWCNSFIYELTKLEGSKLDSETQNGDYIIKHQTISKLFADNLQVIGIFAGYVVDITNDKDIYNVSFVKTNTFSSITDKPTIEDYDGNIYCVTVPTGCIVTRYNDKVLISGNSEVRHKDAYAQLLRILGLENEFQTVIEIPAIKNRISYLAKYLDGTRSKENKMYTKSVLLFSLFIEHVSLFSQFLIMMSFNKEKNLFKGISNVVEATSKEEEIHGNFGSELINIIKEENPEWFDEEFEALIVSACHKAYAAECGILDWIFENGELSFLSKDTIKHFIQNRFNNSLNRIGMKSVFEVDFTEIEKTLWFDVEILSTKEGDFFYKKSIDYNKKSKSITEDDLF